MVEHFIRIPGEFFNLLNGKPAEITHLVAEVNVVLFVTRFLRSMRRKYQSLFYLFNILTVFLIKIECSRQAMRLIQMVHFWFKSYFIEQLGAPYAEQNKLCHFRRNVGVI